MFFFPFSFAVLPSFYRVDYSKSTNQMEEEESKVRAVTSSSPNQNKAFEKKEIFFAKKKGTQWRKPIRRPQNLTRHATHIERRLFFFVLSSFSFRFVSFFRLLFSFFLLRLAESLEIELAVEWLLSLADNDVTGGQ